MSASAGRNGERPRGASGCGRSPRRPSCGAAVSELAGTDRRSVSVHLVPMRRRHLRSVLRIEGQVYPKPWTLSLFLGELGLRSSRYYIVARVDGEVVGYAGIMISLDEAHVTTIAVDPAWQRHGIGRRLLLNVARAALARHARHLTLEVRVSNANAQRLYQEFGFETEGLRKNYYAESGEDALIMWAHWIDSDAYAQRLAGIEASVEGGTVDETRAGS
jgi:[ribosomal protein S18]-alanine N-acetyltransferase